MKYVFGPVPSRRLGQSLGVDPVPLKTCNWNCVYCQLGRSRPMVGTRSDFAPCEDIVDELRCVLADRDPATIDWVTVVGSGEPLLHAQLGTLLRRIKALTTLPVALITNGTFLYRPEVRAEVLPADAILPTLDAGTAALHRSINRPHPAFTYEHLVEGLIALSREYRGELRVEVMLISGVNDTEEALSDIARQLARIDPDEIHINLPSRPPAEPWLEAPDSEALARAVAVFEEIASVHAVGAVVGAIELPDGEALDDGILSVIRRHPLRREELEGALVGYSVDQIRQALADLKASGRAQVVVRNGRWFWTDAEAFFPERGAR